MITIVPETAAHAIAREALLDRAFGASRFAKTCERLREGRLPAEGLALAMLYGNTLIGTIRLWEVTLGQTDTALMLGPVAIAPTHQGMGLGAWLIENAIDTARRLGHRAIVLVGDAPYYERFGFTAAAVDNLWMPGPVERERFLGLELEAGALSNAAGFVLGSGRAAPRPELRELIMREAMAA